MGSRSHATWDERVTELARAPRRAITWAWWIPLAVLLAGVLLLCWSPGPLQVLRNTGFDGYQRVFPRARPALPLVQVVDIDDESLRRLGQWPWPRTRLAALVNRLKAAGARAIVFDSLFPEADRTAPAAMARAWQVPPAAAQVLRSLPDPDTVFAKAMRQSRRVVLGHVLVADAGAPPPGAMPLPVQLWASAGAMDAPLFDFSRDVGNVPALSAAAAGVGTLNFVPEADGVVRRVPLLTRYGQQLAPSLALEALRVAQQVPGMRVWSAGAQAVLRVEVGDTSIPTDARATVWVYYAASGTSVARPAWQVLERHAPQADLAGTIVLVGTSAQGLMDVRSTSQGVLAPGVDIQAQLVEQLLQGQVLTRPAWGLLAEACALVVLGLVALAAVRRFSALRAALLTLCAVLLYTGLCWALFAKQRLLLDATIPCAGVALVFVCASVLRHLEVEMSRAWIRQAFARYISPNRVQHLLDHPQALRLSGQRQECSFIFTDIAGFTTLIEQEGPQATIAALNRYIDGMVAIAFAHQGTLDRIMGDGLSLVFSAPLPQEDHAARALRCALALHDFAQQFSAQECARGLNFGATRIAVHTGSVVVGNFGGSTILDYRALGDPVNTTARMESANKVFGTAVCVSEALWLASGQVTAVRPIARVLLKGKSQELQLLEPLESVPVGQVAPLADYAAAYACLGGAVDDALPVWEQLHAAYPQDALVAFHLQRLRRGDASAQVVLESK